jgi:hypothetical protein
MRPEYDDLVVTSLVVFDEELGGAELVRIHRAQQHLLQRLHRQIFSVINKASHRTSVEEDPDPVRTDLLSMDGSKS